MSMINGDLQNLLSQMNEETQITTEVFLPMVKKSVLVKELDSVEEVALLDSDGTQATWNNNLNRLLFNKLDTSISDEETKNAFKDFDSFLNNITSIDKTALIAGLVKLSYDELPPKQVKCSKCDKQFTVVQTVDEAITDKAFVDVWNEQESILDYTWNFDFKLGKLLFTVNCKFVSEKDLSNIIDFYKFDPEHQKLLEKFERLYTVEDELVASVDSIEITTDNGSSTYTELHNIIAIIDKLNLKQKRAFLQKVSDNGLPTFSVDFTSEVECSHCGHTQEVWTDPTKELLRLPLDFI